MATTQPVQRTAGPTVTPTQMQSIKNTRWLNLVRRCEQLAMSQNGHAVLNLTVFVDSNGYPVVWTTPRMTLIEPKDGSQSFLDILASL